MSKLHEELEVTEDIVARLSNRIAKIKKELAEWPKDGDTFYFINAGGYTQAATWDGVGADGYKKLTGNVFRTEEEAEHHKAKLIAIGEVNQIIKEENGDWMPDWSNSDQIKGHFYYNLSDQDVNAEYYTWGKRCSHLQYFSPDSQDSIKKRITPEQINLIFDL